MQKDAQRVLEDWGNCLSLQSSAYSPKVAGGPEDNTAVGNGHPRGNGDRRGQRAPERAGGQVGDLQFDVVRED